MADNRSAGDLLALTTEIVAAHVANNPVAVADLPKLIGQVYTAIAAATMGAAAIERPQPAVPIRKSVTRDYIICLEDGKKLKMLKRHLSTSFGLTPNEYRERWGLPSDYPMVAPSYVARRRALAKKIGLGTRFRRRRRKS